MENLYRCIYFSRVWLTAFYLSFAILISHNLWAVSGTFTVKNLISSAMIQSITCPQSILMYPDGLSFDGFGCDVDIDGDTAVVGAEYNEYSGLRTPGAAYVYVKEATVWNYAGKLTASDCADYDHFGFSVAISGDTIAIGSHKSRGCVYIYEKPTGGWTHATETAKLVVSGTEEYTCSNIWIDIDGDTVAMGYPDKNISLLSNAGEAYVFAKPAGGWIDTTQTAILRVSDHDIGYSLGCSVSVYGDTIVVGACGATGISGTRYTGGAYVFEKPAGGWSDMTETAKLIASDGDGGDYFGLSASIFNDTVVIGATAGDFTGTAYVFLKPAGGWINATENAKLTPSDSPLYDCTFFSQSVAIGKERIYIGSYDSGGDQRGVGAVFYYDKPASGWISTTETEKIVAFPESLFSQMGVSLSVDGTTVISGAIHYKIGSDVPGAAYIFEAPESESAILSLEPTGIEVPRCAEQEIAVHISDAIGVAGYRIVLNYDPSQLTYVSGSATIDGTSCEGDWFSGIVNDASPGQVIFTSASLGSPFPAGAATLVKFTFKVNCFLPDFEEIHITFDETLTSINDGAIPVTHEPWTGGVHGANIPPSFMKGGNILVLEDSGGYSSQWASNITAGTDYEDAYQSIWFEITSNSNPGLFSAGPAIDASGILTFTPAPDEFGSASIEVVLRDDGGTANGGSDTSVPHSFTISVGSVNDPPSFLIPSATAVVLNETAGLETFVNFATGISPGPANESAQTVVFSVTNDCSGLFDAEPAIDPSGTLSFTPAAGAHGVACVTAVLVDNGGTASGGIDTSASALFLIKIYIPYLWGELSNDGIVGAMDAWNALMYYVGLTDEFPAYPPDDYPEYYPENVPHAAKFPPAGDVNWDGALAALDASLILQQFALLIDYFPADLNQDDWGPDSFYPGDTVFQWAKKANRRNTVDERSISVTAKYKKNKTWAVTFYLDNAADVLGFRMGLMFDGDFLSARKNQIKLKQKDGLLVINDRDPGKLIVSGAFLQSLQAGRQELISMEFTQLKEPELSQDLTITVDENWTDINDGHIHISPSSLREFDLQNPTGVTDWEIH